LLNITPCHEAFSRKITPCHEARSPLFVVKYAYHTKRYFENGRVSVRKLKLHAQYSLAATIVFAVAGIAAFILRPPYWVAYEPVILAIGLVALLHYIPSRKEYSAAQLIIENTIIRIKLADMHGQTEWDIEEAEKLKETYVIYISTFGILLGDKIISWGGKSEKRLKAVEIGRDHISIDYGTKENNQNIRLLYARPGEDELAEIIEKFRYETNVVPTVTG